MTRNLLHRAPTGTATGLAAPRRRSVRRLAADELDLWRVALDGGDDPALRALLSADEEDRARGFYFERDRRRFIVGRAMLRRVLACYVGIAPEELEFDYGETGKPELALGATAPRFNVAHSEDIAVFAITSGSEVGVDVERLRELPDDESIAEAYFSAAEQARLRSVSPALRRVEFFRAWTRQEAILKATGTGLGALDDGDVDGFTEARSDGENPAFHGSRVPQLRVYPFVPADGYVAAVAAEPEVRWVTFFNGGDGKPGTRMPDLRHGRRRRLDQMAKTGADFL